MKFKVILEIFIKSLAFGAVFFVATYLALHALEIMLQYKTSSAIVFGSVACVIGFFVVWSSFDFSSKKMKDAAIKDIVASSHKVIKMERKQ